MNIVELKQQIDMMYYNSPDAARLIDLYETGEISELECYKLISVKLYGNIDKFMCENIKKRLKEL